jgi:hypothetical protein
MEAKYKALVEAYEAVGDQVPDYAWPNGDPGASGQQLEQYEIAYNAYYNAISAQIANAEALVDDILAYKEGYAQWEQMVLFYEQQKAAYDDAVSAFSVALVADLFSSNVTASVANVSPAKVLFVNVTTVAQGIADGQKAFKIIDKISSDTNLPGITLDNVTSYVSSNAGTIASYINNAGGAITVSLHENISVSGVGAQYDATYTYTISQTTLDAAAAVAAFPPLAVPSPPVMPPFTSITAVDGSSYIDTMNAQAASAYALIDVAVKRFEATVVSANVSGGTDVYYAKNGEAKTFALSFADAFPTDGGDDADFEDYDWTVTTTGDVIDAATVSSGVLTVSIQEDVLGDGTVTVTAKFNATGEYNVVQVTPLTFTVKVVDSMVFDGANPYTATADSTQADQTVALPAVQNAVGAVAYTVVPVGAEESKGRVTYDEATKTVKVAKDANAGTYTYAVSAVDSQGFTAETTLVITVTNANDAAYAAQLARVQAVQDQVNQILGYISLLPEGSLDQSYLSSLLAFADLTTPLETMWNDGEPVLNTAALTELLTAASAFGANLGLDVSTITNALSILQSFNLLTLDKDVFVNGYFISRPYFGSYTIPSIPTLYADAVESAWNAFAAQFAPINNLIAALEDLADYVANTDYASIDSLNEVNAYIQGLAAKYAAVDAALNAFADSDSIITTIVEVALENSTALLKTGLQLVGATGEASLNALINPYIDEYVTDLELNAQLKALLSQGYGELLGAISTGVDGLPQVTLADIVAWSGEVNAALQKVALISQCITDKVNAIIAFIENVQNVDRDALKAALKDQLDLLELYLKAQLEAAIDQAQREAIAALIDAVQELREQILSSETLAQVKAFIDDVRDAWETAVAVIKFIDQKVDDLLDFAKQVKEAYEQLEALVTQFAESVQFAAVATIAKIEAAIAQLEDIIDYLEGVDWEQLSEEALAEIQRVIGGVLADIQAQIPGLITQLQDALAVAADKIEEFAKEALELAVAYINAHPAFVITGPDEVVFTEAVKDSDAFGIDFSQDVKDFIASLNALIADVAGSDDYAIALTPADLGVALSFLIDPAVTGVSFDPATGVVSIDPAAGVIPAAGGIPENFGFSLKVITGNANVDAVLDSIGIVLASKDVTVKNTDKSELAEAIADGETVTEGVDEDGETLYDQLDSLKDEIAAARDADLSDEQTAALDALEDLVAQLEDALAALEDALAAAEAVYADPNATQQQINDATDALNAAIAAVDALIDAVNAAIDDYNAAPPKEEEPVTPVNPVNPPVNPVPIAPAPVTPGYVSPVTTVVVQTITSASSDAVEEEAETTTSTAAVGSRSSSSGSKDVTITGEDVPTSSGNAKTGFASYISPLAWGLIGAVVLIGLLAWFLAAAKRKKGEEKEVA